VIKILQMEMAKKAVIISLCTLLVAIPMHLLCILCIIHIYLLLHLHLHLNVDMLPTFQFIHTLKSLDNQQACTFSL
jgi:hypothetical protein